MTSCRQIVTSLSFFQFMTNLQPSGSPIPDAWSIKLTLSLTMIFYLIKTENKTKKSLTQLSYRCFLTICKKMRTSAKNADINKIKSWYYNVYFLKLHICVYLRTKFQVSSIILTSFRQGVILPHTTKRTPKKFTLIRDITVVQKMLPSVTEKESYFYFKNLVVHCPKLWI